MNNRHPDGPDAPTAQRARLLRRAIEGDDIGAQARFAARIGVSQSRWSNVERGYPVSRDLGDRLMLRIPGFSKDWIEHGRHQSLSVDLWQKLLALSANHSDENANTGR